MGKINIKNFQGTKFVMNSAYDVPQIHDMSRQLGHIPLIDLHPRRDQALKKRNSSRKQTLSISWP